MRAQVVLAVLVTTACGLPAQAAAAPKTVRVCTSGPPACDVSSVSGALSAVAADGRIVIAPGTYAGGFSITKSVTMVGAGAASTRLTGGTVSVAAGNDVVLRSLSLDGAEAPQTQLINDGALTLRDAAIASGPEVIGESREVGAILNNGSLSAHNTQISGQGQQVGGLRNNGTAVLIDSRVSESGGNVGGIENLGRLLIQGSSIVDNSATFDGGIRNDGDLVIRKSKINDNGGQGPGGIINTAKAVVVDTELRRNQLTGVINEGDLTLRGVTVSGWGTGVGYARGGIYNLADASLVLSDSTVDGSDVSSQSYQHPGIDNAGTMTITATQIKNTRNSLPGGAITNQGTLTVRQSSIDNSRSERDGGAIFNEGTLTLRQSQISSSVADGSGGGLFNVGTAVLTGALVTGNTALDLQASGIFGGGVANVSPGSLAVQASTISGNTPDDCSGC